MKKVTFYFKSGNKLKLRCKTFRFTYEEKTKKGMLEMTGVNKVEWMIDLSELEGYTISKCFFYYPILTVLKRLYIKY